MLNFRDARFQELAQAHAAEYQRAEPFPHIVLDNFLAEEDASEILAEFPDFGGKGWVEMRGQDSIKLATRGEGAHGEAVARILAQFNSAQILKFLETLTGIKGLIPDPYFFGAGLHQIQRGGFLKIHADFNQYDVLRLDRRINLLLYLNRDWKEEYGGHLELWNRSMTECAHRILPVFNRCVIFNTTDWAYHGHPHPLTCPPEMGRKSVAIYYYTNGRPEEERADAHSTLYQMRPEDHARLATFPNRTRTFLANSLEGAARLAQKPASLLRIIAGKLRPPAY